MEFLKSVLGIGSSSSPTVKEVSDLSIRKSKAEESESDEENEDAEIVVEESLPTVPRTAITPAAVAIPPPLKIKGIGNVTVLENCLSQGVIEGKYYFCKEKFQTLVLNGLERGDKVEFEAVKDESTILWEVTQMKIHLSDKELEIECRRRFKTIVGEIIQFQNSRKVAIVKYGKTLDEVQEIPFDALPSDFEVIRGDFLRIKLEAQEANIDDASDAAIGKIISVEPTKKKTIVGKITLNKHGAFSVDQHIYFEPGCCTRDYKPNVHDVVRCVAVESKYDRYFNWRAVSIRRSNFQTYTAADKQDEGWLDKENIWESPLTDLMSNKNGVFIEPKNLLNFGEVRVGSSRELLVQIKNTSDENVSLQSVNIHHDQSVCKFSAVLLTPKEADTIITILEPDTTYDLKISCSPTQIGGTRELCIFEFRAFQIGRHLAVNALSNQDEVLNGISNNTVQEPRSSKVPKWQERESEAVIDQLIEDKNKMTVRACAPYIRAPFFQPKKLDDKFIPKILWTIVKEEDDNLLLEHFPSALKALKIETYYDKFELALWLEEIQNDILRRQHDVKNTLLEKAGEYFKFEVPGLRDIHPPIQIGDPVTIYDHADGDRKYATNVFDIRGSHVFIKFEHRDQNTYNNNVTVQFNLSRTTYKRCHNAIKQAEKYLNEKWLFPSEEIEIKPPRLPFFEDEIQDDVGKGEETNGATNGCAEEKLRNNGKDIESKELFFKSKRSVVQQQLQQEQRPLGARRKESHRAKNLFVGSLLKEGPSLDAPSKAIRLKWFNTSLNKEQKDAVRRILRGQARPLPYIVFGPPGTGKTVTVVEALIQVYKLYPNSRILAVAPSNSAADVIADHLVRSNQFLPGDFIRLVGFLRQEIQIPESIRDYCVDGDNLETVARHKLIVATCTTAGQFMNLGLDTNGHFTHVFIDEAGYCTEPEAIIPVVLCALSKEGQVILAGDPQQLGPVLMSDVAANCGLNLSLLERLTSLPLYARNAAKFPEEKYNPVVLTKLVKNYRAHPTLLKLPSQLFYDDELEPAVRQSDVDICHELEFLGASKGIPLLFHGVQGRCEREEDSPSWYNKAEIIQVLEYVRNLRNCGLSNDEIGIITPYRKQVEKIRRALELGLLQTEIPKVGSVEEFQGGERMVMILSLVRSVSQDQTNKIIDRMSFIFSSKRFNVAITRAKALLIVIGNPHIMAHDHNWYKFLKYCIDLGCYVGCNLPLYLDELTQKYLTELRLKEEEDGSTPKLFQSSNGNRLDFYSDKNGDEVQEEW